MKQLLYLMLMIIFPMISFSQTISSVSPSSVNAGQTLDVTITGSNTHFTDPNGTNLYFGFAPGSSTMLDCINSLTIVDDVTMTANVSVPSYSNGDYDVQVINSIDGTIPPGTIHVNPNAAELIGMTPGVANAGQTLDVTITGSSTHFADAATTVSFGISQASGTIQVNSVTPVSNTSLTVNITISANTYSGFYAVSVSNSMDNYMNTPDYFQVENGLAPATLVSMNPSSGHAGQTLNVLISATGSSFTLAANTLDFGFGPGTGVNSIDVLNDTLLLANITIPDVTWTGYQDVTVSNSVNGAMTDWSGFLVYGNPDPNDPNITVSPDNGDAGQTLNVTITGTGTNFTQASTTSSSVYLSSATLNGEVIQGTFTIVDDVTIEATFEIPAGHLTETMNISTYMVPGGNITLYQGFRINGDDPLFAFVIPTPESTEGACDGESEIVVSGGTGPYAYTVDGNTTGIPVTSGLCEGLHDVVVEDMLGNIINISFVIVPPTGVYTTQTYVDSIMTDTIYNDVITQCDIDYDAIGSIYIESIAQLGGNDVAVTWHVGYGAGQWINITDVYNLSDFNGVYSLALELFCPNKSLGQNLIAYDQIYYSPGVAGYDENDPFGDAVIYPNPFSGNVTIALSKAQQTSVFVTDITGKIVLEKTGSDQLIQLSTDGLASGQYMLVLKSASSVAARKVVKL